MFDQKFIQFVQEHESDDLTRLVLARASWPGIDVPLAASCIESRRKLRTKCPRWASPDILCPAPLSAEQCSSTQTARLKATLLLGAPAANSAALEQVLGGSAPLSARSCSLPPAALSPFRVCKQTPGPAVPLMREETSRCSSVADLTGGLGVDCTAFAEVAERVLYNEMNPTLVEASRHNFEALGITNAEFSCREVTVESVGEILEPFGPELVFMDPARRSAAGSKVFRLADCSPDILGLLPEIFKVESVQRVMVKISPMADITQVSREVGNGLSDVHIVGSAGECKELLLIIDRSSHSEPTIHIHLCDTPEPAEPLLSFTPSAEQASVPATAQASPAPGTWLFEPCKALMKAGCWNILSERFGISRLGKDAHIYCAPDKVDGLDGLGGWHLVKDVAPFGKQAMKDFAARYPHSEVLARGLKLSSDELRAKMKLASGEDARIYALGCGSLGNLLIATD